jgi:hypothetical protein
MMFEWTGKYKEGSTDNMGQICGNCGRTYGQHYGYDHITFCSIDERDRWIKMDTKDLISSEEI